MKTFLLTFFDGARKPRRDNPRIHALGKPTIILFVILGLALTAGFFGDSRAQSGLANSSWPIFRSDAALTAQAKKGVKGPMIPELKTPIQHGSGEMLSPVVAEDGTIVFVYYGHTSVYFAKPAGELYWEFVIPGAGNTTENFIAEPVIGKDGRVYIGSTDARLYGIDFKRKKWWRSEPLGGQIKSAVNISRDSTVFVATTYPGKLYAFAAFSDIARQKWEPRDLFDTKRALTPAIDAKGNVYVGCGSKIHVFDSTGNRLRALAHPKPDSGDFEWVMASSPLSLVFAGSKIDPVVIAFRVHDGTVVWNLPKQVFNPTKPPALGNDRRLYLVGEEANMPPAGRLLALNASDGMQPFLFNLAGFTSMPVIDETGRVYVLTKAGDQYELYSLIPANANNNVVFWRKTLEMKAPINKSLRQSAAFGPDSTIYVPGYNQLYVVAPQSPYATSFTLVSGDKQTGCIDSMLVEPLRVRIEDQYQSPLPNYPVQFNVVSGGGKLNPLVDSTDSRGIAETRWVLGPKPGEQQAKAEAAITDASGQQKNASISFAATATSPKIGGEREIVFDSTEIKHDTVRIYYIRNKSAFCTLRVHDIKITDDAHPSFSALDNVRNRLIPSGDSLAIRLKFAPQVADTHRAIMHIFSNASDTLEVILRGKGYARPIIVVKPESLDFGEVCIGSSKTDSLKIANKGTGDLLIRQLLFPQGSAFGSPSKPSPEKPLKIGENESVFIDVTFSPVQVGNDTATLGIVSNDPHPDRDTLRVLLSGVGIGPEISGEPKRIFDATAVNASSTKDYLIHNAGRCTLRIDSLAIKNGEDSTFHFCRPDTIERHFIEPNGSLEVCLRFAPNKVGNHTATLYIYSNDFLNNPYKVHLEGMAVPCIPEIDIDPDSLDFGDVCIDSYQKLDLTISNDSCAVLDIALFSSDTAFHAEPDTVEFAPGSSKTVAITFHPKLAKDYLGILTITSNGPNKRSWQIRLRGRGIGPNISGKSQVDFDSVKVGEQKMVPYQIVNSGRCDLQIFKPVIAGKDSSDFSDCTKSIRWPTIIPPGGSLSLNLCFAPRGCSSWRNATLRIYSSDSTKNPFSVHLRGFGIGDTIAPAKPLGLTATPSDWSQANKFSLTWQNPSDASGMAKACYKVGTPPVSNTDGMCVNVTKPPRIDNVVAPAPGRYAVYVWLADSCGNADFRNVDSVFIKFDNVPPPICHKPDTLVPFKLPVTIPLCDTTDSASGIKAFTLYYRQGGQANAFTQPFSNGVAVIPGKYVAERGVEYAIKAEDNAKNETWFPPEKKFYSLQVRLPADSVWTTHRGGATESAYRIRSFPLELDEPLAKTIVRHNFPYANPDHLDPRFERLWDIDPAKAESMDPYCEYPNVRDFVPGHAVFLITRDSIKLKNTKGLTVKTGSNFVIQLHKGWNLIASPFNFAIPYQNSSLPSFHDSAFAYIGEWKPIDPTFKFMPWEGVMIKVVDGDPRFLTITPSEKALNTISKTNDVPIKAGADWFIRINALCRGAKDVINTVGIAPDAAMEWDAYELLEPPPIGDYVTACFSQHDWQKYPDFYTTDFRPRSNDGYEWNFEIQTSFRGEAVNLQLENIQSVPPELQVRLVDADLNFPQDLRREPAYRFRSSDIEENTRRFRLVVGNDVFVEKKLAGISQAPQKFDLAQNFPNPFNPVTTIKFGLPKAASVSLIVYNVKGEVARRLINTQEKVEGYHLVLWDGRDDSGNSVTSGLYFYQLKAGNLTLTRKMILAK